MFSRLLRVYSYLYHAVLVLFLLAISAFAKLNESSTFRLDVLPWKGEELANWLFWGSLAGVISVLLAMTGIFRFLFPVWAAVVLWYMVRGFLLQPYTFSGVDEFYSTLALIAGAFVAFLGSLTVFKRREVRYR